MNGIRLFFKSAKGSVLSSLTLFVVLGAVLLTLNYTLSQYLYIRRAGEMFENAGLSGGLHFVNTTPYDAEGQEALDARIESLRESGEMEKLITRRSAGVTIGGTEYQLVLYDVDVYPAMYGAPHKGSWPEGGEPLGGVVAGVNPSSVPVGETVMVRSSIPGNDASLEVQITGTLAYPPMTFQTGYYISNISMMTADNFFGEERLLYVPYSEALAATVTASFNLGSASPVSSGILLFTEDTSAERREEIRKELSVYAQVTPVDTILQSTRAHVSESCAAGCRRRCSCWRLRRWLTSASPCSASTAGGQTLRYTRWRAARNGGCCCSPPRSRPCPCCSPTLWSQRPY